MKIVEKINLTREIVDEDHFRLGYCEDIDEYLLCICVTWVAWYDRYYRMEGIRDD